MTGEERCNAEKRAMREAFTRGKVAHPLALLTLHLHLEPVHGKPSLCTLRHLLNSSLLPDIIVSNLFDTI
jgi:hypothetical protein